MSQIHTFVSHMILDAGPLAGNNITTEAMIRMILPLYRLVLRFVSV